MATPAYFPNCKLLILCALDVHSMTDARKERFALRIRDVWRRSSWRSRSVAFSPSNFSLQIFLPFRIYFLLDPCAEKNGKYCLVIIQASVYFPPMHVMRVALFSCDLFVFRNFMVVSHRKCHVMNFWYCRISNIRHKSKLNFNSAKK